jgi:hypothetical protein
VALLCSYANVGQVLLTYMNALCARVYGFEASVLRSIRLAYGFYVEKMGYVPHSVRDGVTVEVKGYTLKRPRAIFNEDGDSAGYFLIKAL